MNFILNTQIRDFETYLINEEKSAATVSKYVHDVAQFANWVGEKSIEKSLVLLYKNELTETMAPTSVNSILSSLNCFFGFLGRLDLKVKNLKIQKQIFASTEKELTKEEYDRLLIAAKQKKNERLCLLMQAICSTGIRVSEVRFITVEAIQKGYAQINCKGKNRSVFLPAKLCKRLKEYIREQKIKSGPVFVTRTGNSLDRSNIWSDMKKLCKSAGVSDKKVFPHNLRHLFARTYYSIQKDIVRLADILGHSSVNTTRIYTMESGEIHRKQIQNLGLLRC